MGDEAIRRVEAALDEIRRGRIVILSDDEDRENEGDLCMAAGFATPDAIAFMASKGRGLICVSLTPDRVDALRLPMMTDANRSRLGTAFTVSIEARHGVTTGISAADRALTIRIAAGPAGGPDDLVSPGHVFPLRAAPGGVLQRTGQTEGAVDLARLAGLAPAGVICEVVNEDGTMARRPQLERFAAEHGLAMLSVADIIAYRLQRERLVRRAASSEIDIDVGGEWLRAAATIYETSPGVDGGPIVALAVGDMSVRPLPVRVHRESWTTDALRIRGIDGLHVSVGAALEAIRAAGGGVLLWLPPAPDLTFADMLRRRREDGPEAAREIERPPVFREIGLGSQVLRDLGADEIALITNNPRVFAGIEGFGLRIVRFVDPGRPGV
ncbi:MAG: 3,4-dihydroxy-2-butanone-4-phosphate synthase [Myxococcota bacterium]|nr:3,4-dihydroxy-2-butanone-4-phosphate synthase [Myxococcota bacterium]